MVEPIHKIIEKVSPYYAKKGKPEAEHKLVYDSSTEILEQIYFFILDLMQDFGFDTEKLIDNFTSTAGGSHFSEIGMKATRMQEEASKMMVSINAVLRSVLNLIYDLKEFKIRLEHYDNLKSKSKDVVDAARLSLKQLWLDRVDIEKGGTSIKQLALSQAGYQTLIDAFLICNNEKDVEKLDLNDRVRRLVKPRVAEFNAWVKRSEQELRKRYEMEKTYLKSQVASLKLYSRWVKPYLRASENLHMEERNRSPELINMFNTVVFELTLFGKSKVNVREAALSGDIPLDFKDVKAEREYYSCVLVDFHFRAYPRQGNALVGRTEVTYRAYGLNQEELDKFYEELDKSDVADVLKLIEGATSESIDHMQEEIDDFLNEVEKKESEQEKKQSLGTNPFLALVGHYNSPQKKKKEDKPKDWQPQKDSWIEGTHIRPLATKGAQGQAFAMFDVYKKVHGMASYT